MAGQAEALIEDGNGVSAAIDGLLQAVETTRLAVNEVATESRLTAELAEELASLTKDMRIVLVHRAA